MKFPPGFKYTHHFSQNLPDIGQMVKRGWDANRIKTIIGKIQLFRIHDHEFNLLVSDGIMCLYNRLNIDINANNLCIRLQIIFQYMDKATLVCGNVQYSAAIDFVKYFFEYAHCF